MPAQDLLHCLGKGLHEQKLSEADSMPLSSCTSTQRAVKADQACWSTKTAMSRHLIVLQVRTGSCLVTLGSAAAGC